MTGREYIDGGFVKELSYNEAIQASRDELVRFFKLNNDCLTMGNMLDNPIYPANADLYDEFCFDSEYGLYFDTEEFLAYLIRLENNGTRCRLDLRWEGIHEDVETYYLRELTVDEKADLGL